MAAYELDERDLGTEIKGNDQSERPSLTYRSSRTAHFGIKP
jgi:hypothetical protein